MGLVRLGSGGIGTLRIGWFGVLALAGAGFLASVSSLAAAAQTRVPEVGTAATRMMADFEGRHIDLATDWEQARACVVLRQADVTRCFRSHGDADAEAKAVGATYTAAGFSCAYPLRLSEHANFGGRQLYFFDRFYWQNLTDFGFNDQMSSYVVGACRAYLAEHVTGGGALYPGPTAPWSAVPWPAAHWDNRVSSIYLA